MSMSMLLTGLLGVLAVCLLVWSVETFWLQPRRMAALVASFKRGSLDQAGLVTALRASPAYIEQVRWGSGLSLMGLLGLAMLGRVDIDFSLVLVTATFLCGIGWGLDIILTRGRRLRYLRELAPDNASPLAVTLRHEPLLVEYAHSFFPVLAVVLVLRSFLVEPFTIPSGSMLPTLEVGDYILVNKYTYGLRLPVTGTEIVPMNKPQRGDVMVFRFPPKPTMNFIKRVIGLPGDHIRTTENGDVFVNGERLEHTLVRQEPAVDPWEQYFDEKIAGVNHSIRQEVGADARRKVLDLTVPAGHYFMMGDNRDNSNDSRFWGPVAEHLIVGKAVYVWIHKEPGLNLPVFSRNGAVR